MQIRLCVGAMIFAFSQTAAAANPDEPVGPVKPVEVVNETLSVEVEGDVNAVLDEPVEVFGAVSTTENRQVFQYKRSLPIPAGQPAGATVRECFSVPSDRWLIIQQVHSRLLSETSATASPVQLHVELNANPSGPIGIGFSVRFDLEPVGDRQAVSLPGTFFNLMDQATLYSSPGSSVCLYLQRGFDGFSLPEETGSVSLFGVLTDQP